MKSTDAYRTADGVWIRRIPVTPFSFAALPTAVVMIIRVAAVLSEFYVLLSALRPMTTLV